MRGESETDAGASDIRSPQRGLYSIVWDIRRILVHSTCLVIHHAQTRTHDSQPRTARRSSQGFRYLERASEPREYQAEEQGRCRYYRESTPTLLIPSLLSDINGYRTQFAKRTALTRAKKGAFRDTSSDTLLHSLLQKGMDQSGVDRHIVGDIIAGVCHTPSPAYEVRAASLAAGFPETTPAEAINRLCSSGLMAIRHISDSVARGDLEVGVAVGYESMSSQ